mgnify:CR=1 FL=1
MILDTIAASTLERVAAAKEALPLAEQIARARDLDSNTGFPFEQALVKQGIALQGTDRSGISLCADCEGIRNSRSGCNFRTDGTGVLSREE